MRLPQPSTVIATIALVAACAGSATAATVITGKQIRNGTVTGADIKNRSLTGKDIRLRSLSSSHLKPASVKMSALDPATVTEMQATLTTTRVSRSEPRVYTPDDYNPKSLAVSCPDGEVALGGGGGFTNNQHLGRLASSKPVIDANGTPRGWEISMGPDGGGGGNRMEVYAICAPEAAPVTSGN